MKSNLLKFIGLLSLGLALSCESITDIYPPELKLISPTEEILSTDSVTFLIDVTDNIGVDRVEITLQDSYSGWSLDTTLKSEPYEITVTDVQSLEEIELDVIGFDAVGNFDQFNKTFEIATAVENASITVVKPNGNETWLLGSTQAITWTSEHVTSDVKIELYRGTEQESTIKSSTDNDGNYSWDIPTSLTAASDYKVKIIAEDNSTIYDMSDTSFAITLLECDEGEVVDCNGKCGPQSWLGDGYCDDETYVYEGNYIDYNCEEHDYDNGDCSSEASFYEDFSNLNSWTNDGWQIANNVNCSDPPCALHYTGSTSQTNTMSMNVNVTEGQSLSFWVYVYSPSGTLEFFVNNELKWSKSGYGTETPSFNITGSGTMNIKFVGSGPDNSSIYLDELFIE